MNASDPSGMMCLDALDPFSSGFSQCWSSGYSTAGNDLAHGSVGLCLSGGLGSGPAVVGQICLVESGGFKHVGFTETLGGGGSSPSGGVSLGLQFSNATTPKDLGGLFAYTDGSVVLGPDVGLTAGGSGFIGNGPCNRVVFGGNVNVGLGANLPIPVSAGAGATYTWTQTLW